MKQNYTTRARRFAIKYPILSYVSSQTSFWIVAYVLLAVIVHLASVNLSRAFSIPIETGVWPTF